VEEEERVSPAAFFNCSVWTEWEKGGKNKSAPGGRGGRKVEKKTHPPAGTGKEGEKKVKKKMIGKGKEKKKEEEERGAFHLSFLYGKNQKEAWEERRVEKGNCFPKKRKEKLSKGDELFLLHLIKREEGENGQEKKKSRHILRNPPHGKWRGGKEKKKKLRKGKRVKPSSSPWGEKEGETQGKGGGKNLLTKAVSTH